MQFACGNPRETVDSEKSNPELEEGKQNGRGEET